MALYFFQLRDGKDELLDTDGMEFADLGALQAAALICARDVISGDVLRAGLVDFRCRIDAEDAFGKVVYSLPFKEAVHIAWTKGD